MIEYNEALRLSMQYFGGNELAASTFLNKYALKDPKGKLLETTPDDMHRRLAKEFARIEAKYPNPLSEEEIYSYLKDFKKLIPQGSPMAGIGNKSQLLSLSNCFVIDSPWDSYSGITYTDSEMVSLMKRRAGVGFDISNLRPLGTFVANAAGTSTGIGGWMERYSRSTREVCQDGRRGALMISISCRHPEIETFITIKEDLQKVTGANVSIRFSDDFMNAVKNDEEFMLRWPVEGPEEQIQIKKMVRAKDIWNKFVKSAWTSAEPGALFWDTATRLTPSDCYADYGFKSISTNPCGEIILSGGDSCRLLLVNSFAFVKNPFTKEAVFDFNEFTRVSRIGQRLMDDLVDLELEAIDKILEKIESDPEPNHIKRSEYETWLRIKNACTNGRRTGLGQTAVGDVLAALGMIYGSDDSIGFTENLYKTFTLASYRESVNLAKERGAFPVFSHGLEKGHEFLEKIWAADVELYQEYLKHGRRNIANTTTPPAGTTSMMACVDDTKRLFGTSSGIEPAYLLFYKRRKKVNPNDKDVKVDFVDDLGDKWQEFFVHHNPFKLWMELNGKSEENVSESPYYKATANDIDWVRSVDIQAAAQKWICHSISKTCNLPNSTTQELVSDVYLRAWESGCKGFTIYRDGSRSGVLVSADSKAQKTENFASTDAPKRPKELVCDIHHCTVQGEKWTMFVGLLEGKPYEIMGGLAKYVKIPKRVTRGKLVKHNGNINPARYDLHYDFEDGPENETVIQDVGNVFENPTHAGFTRMVSLSLRHGAPIQYVVEQLVKGSDKESDLFSVTKAFSRVLKGYIKDGTKTGLKKCPDCGSDRMAYKDGCVQCLDCGSSKCG